MSRRRTGPATRSGGVRVLGGRWRGRRLDVPAGVRPTQARVREALFSHWGDRVAGSRLLELYAGSGAVSCEALSRGAAYVLAVDRSQRSLACLRANGKGLGTEKLRLCRAELPGGLSAAVATEATFELVFLDPPYAVADPPHEAGDPRSGGFPELLAAVSALVADGGEVVLEHSSRSRPPGAAGRLRLRQTRRYGDTALTLYALTVQA